MVPAAGPTIYSDKSEGPARAAHPDAAGQGRGFHMTSPIAATTLLVALAGIALGAYAQGWLADWRAMD